MIKSAEKEAYFSQPREDVVGSPEDKKTYIYRLVESDVMVREVEIDSKKGGEPVQILQFTDTHLNRMNKRDWEERNPAIMSTRQFRMAFRNESTVGNLRKAMELVPFFDQTVITGDIMDYQTWGSIELMHEEILDKCPTLLMATGGHDYAKKMEGQVFPTESYEEIAAVLKENWPHDIYYHSQVLQNKVMLVVMDNNGSYRPEQVEKFSADLQKAREEDLIILIFQHEPISTHNPKDCAVNPFRMNAVRADIPYADSRFLCKTGDKEEHMQMFRLISENADIVKGLFCGHNHNDFYTEIWGSYEKDGQKVLEGIPQYILTGNMYDEGHVRIITVK